MAELDDRRLDALLGEAAATLRFPVAPSMSGAVLAAIAAPPPPQRAVALPSLQGRWRMAAFAVALALAFVLGGIVANPDARTAVGEFFGIVEGQRIEIVPDEEEDEDAEDDAGAARAPTPAPTAEPMFTPLAFPDFAIAVTMSEARRFLDFAPGVPEAPGEPDGIYMVTWGHQPLLILQYAELDLWQTMGGGFFGKGPPASAVIEQPLINGHPGWWIDSGGHEAAFFDAEGNEVRDSRRTVESRVLIWNGEDGRYYRMETELLLEEALTIAESLP